MINVEDYLRLRFASGGRERPAVDCWGLYRLIVGEVRGNWLAEFEGHEDPLRIARTTQREAADGGWVNVSAGEEQPFDAVLMTGLLGDGRATMSAVIHIGCVVGLGKMIDIEEVGGVKVRAFRTTTKLRARPEVANRVRGIYRPAALVASPTFTEVDGDAKLVTAAFRMAGK